MPYPQFFGFPENSAPASSNRIFGLFTAHQPEIDTTTHDPIITKTELIDLFLEDILPGENPVVDAATPVLFGAEGAVKHRAVIDLRTNDFSLFIAGADAQHSVYRCLTQIMLIQASPQNEVRNQFVLAVPLRTIHGGTPRADYELSLMLIQAMRANTSALSSFIVLGY